MYQPDHFRVDDLPQLHALLRARPLATLVSGGALGLYATREGLMVRAGASGKARVSVREKR